jgi:4-amino-4-deoxychorismate lyase
MSVETLWLVDGRRAALDPADRGLAYGDGLFETMAADAGRIRWLDYHFARLREGCRRLRIAAPDEDVIRSEIGAHCPTGSRAVIKLIVTRGSGARGYAPPATANPTRILSISSWPNYPISHYTDGITVRSCRIRLGENPALAGIKHLSRLEQVLARLELEQSDAEEGLLLDSRGCVVGGTSSNVFAVCGDRLLTPPLTRCGVKGVMRRIVLETARQLGIRAVEQDFEPAVLHEASEMFMTNALFGVWPVNRLDEHEYRSMETARQLMRSLRYGPGA